MAQGWLASLSTLWPRPKSLPSHSSNHIPATSCNSCSCTLGLPPKAPHLGPVPPPISRTLLCSWLQVLLFSFSSLKQPKPQTLVKGINAVSNFGLLVLPPPCISNPPEAPVLAQQPKSCIPACGGRWKTGTQDGRQWRGLKLDVTSC